MALRNIDSAIKTALANNDPLLVYHLVKFEKPSQLVVEATSPIDYVYLTDAPYEVEYDDDDDGISQTYTPGGLLKVGKVPESIEAKATNMNLTLSAAKLGKQTGVFNLTTSGIIGSNTDATVTVDIDLFKSGFYPGDIVTFLPVHTASPLFKARINSLHGDGTKIDITNLSSSSLQQMTVHDYRIRFDNSEVNALTSGGATTDVSGNTTFSSVSFDNYINRTATIYRVFSNPATGAMIGTPVLLFKGIIAKGTLNEKAQGGATMQWSLTSHWGDFVRVNGRITSDEFHRGLDSSGLSSEDAAIRPEYVNDLGFQHADSSLNVIASYTDIATRGKSVKRGGLAGLLGGKKYKEEKYEVTREMNLSLNLDAKYIPLVYGVQKVDTIPVFADVVITRDSNSEDNIAAGSTDLFQAQVLCEGPIGGIYDIYMEDKGLVCVDSQDSTARTSSSNDVPCVGLMDRGTVLNGQNLYSGTLLTADQWGSTISVEGEDFYRDPSMTWIPPVLFGPNNSFQNTKTGSDGILHGETFRFPAAKNLQLTVHTGKESQRADQTLVTIANSNDFLVQQNYFRDDKAKYWTGNHQLLDTAYVVTRDTISAEDGKSPELSFVVRGKFVNCHNYDGSYRIAQGVHTSLALGDIANLSLADGGNAGTAQVIDKWYFTNASGVTEHRMRFGNYSNPVTRVHIETNGTAGKFTATKVGTSDTITFISPEYSNNVNAPVAPTTPLTFGGFVFSGSNFTNRNLGANSLSRTVTAVTTTEPIYGGNSREPQVTGMQEITRLYRKYTINLSALPTFTKNAIKVSKLALQTNSITVSATVGSNTVEFILDPTNLDTDTMIYGITGTDANMEKLFGFPGNAVGTTNAQATGVTLTNKRMLYQNSSDSLDPSDASGLTIEVTQENEQSAFFSVKVPSTSSEQTFCNTNNILPLTLDFPSRLSISTAKYAYGVRGSHLDVEQFGDFRVSTNPAMQLLDYLTSTRYGKGLKLDEDLDLASFREVARACDTRSNVIVLFPSGTTLSGTYRYPADTSQPLLWQGTVDSSKTKNVTYDGTSYVQVEFWNVIGKLGRKWNSWYSFETNELVWTDGGAWNIKGSSNLTEPTADNTPTSAVNLRNITTNATVAINTVLHTNLGNPFVKQIDTTRGIISGYTLYDSDDVKYWKYVGWDAPEQRFATRHQTNATIDTSQSLFDNVNSMLRQFNAILRFANGKYFLDQKVKAKPLTDFAFDETITDDDIVGDLKISDKGIGKTFNSVNAQIIDPSNNFEARSIAFYNSNYKKQDKGIPRQGSFEAPGISNYFNARMNIKQVLDESRAGLDISFTMSPRGYLLLAGNLIAITNERFNWTKKLFRIQNLNVRDDLLVDVVAKEHNDGAYFIEFAPSDLVRGYNSGANARPPVKPLPPSALTATNNGGGGIELNWTNADNYQDASHTVEIYRSGTSSWANRKLVGTTKGDSFTDQILNTGAQQRYYWIRYSIQTTNEKIKGLTTINSLYHPLTTGTGVSGNAISITTDELDNGVTVNDGGVTFPSNPSGTPVISAGITSIGAGQPGFFFGHDGNAYKFQVGDPAANNFKFDGTNLSLTGSEFSVAAAGANVPTISGTSTSGKGSLLKADGDVFFGDASGFNIFFDQSEGTLTLTGEMVTENNIATSAITADKISANSINADKIAANSITTDQLAANSITADQIAANSINSDMITANSVVSSLISASTIESSHIKSNSIVATIIDATSISATDIETATLSALSADLGDITAGTMKGGSIPDANNAPGGTETGAFMDLTNGKMVFGNANKHILFDGTNLILSGVTIDANSIVNANAPLGVKEDGTSEATDITDFNFTSGLNLVVSGTEATLSLDVPTDNNFTTAEKTKLTGIDTNANNFSLPTAAANTLGGVKIGSRLTMDSGGVLSANLQSDNNLTNALLTKLNGIETGATGDQTAAEIRTLVESASDSNIFTDADHTKLNNIEAGATGDQTAAEIRTLVGNATDSNVFTDAEKTKLTGVETGATADQTAAEIRTLVGTASDSNVFTDADHTKLDGIETGATGDQTAAEIRTLVGSATDSNVFTDAQQTKLSGIATGANAYVLPTNNVTNASVSGSTLTLSREGETAVTFSDTNTTYSAGSGGGLSLSAGNAFSVDSTVVRTSGTQTIGGTKTFTGNVTFSGTTTYINTTNLNVGDSIITLNADFTGSTATENAGIEVERGDEANVQLLWSESGVGQSGDYTEGWTLGNKRLQAGTFYGNFVGDITGSPTSLAGVTTDDLIESATPDLTGTARGDRNAYFTNARARGAFSAGTGITLAADGTITNSAPDQTVSLTGSGATSISGSYPNFTISSTDTNTTNFNIQASGGTSTNISAGETINYTGGGATSVTRSGNTITITSTDTNTLPNNATITINAGTDLGTGGNFTTNQGSAETITINHSNISRTNNTSSSSPGYGGTFTAIDSITTSARGHVTAVNTKTVTIPASDNTDTNTVTQIREDSGTYRTGNITLQSGTNVTISEPSTGVFNFSSVNTNTTNFNIQASSGTSTNISAGETINYTGGGATTVTRSGNTITITSTDTNTDTNTVTQIREDSGSYRTGNITLQSGTNVTISEPSTGVFNFAATDTNTNYFLNGISKSGNTLTFSVSGATDQSYTFGSNAFNSTAIPSAANNATITLSGGAGLANAGGAFTTNQGSDETITFSIGAGTGITVNTNDVAISDTGVTAGNYGSSTSIPSITVNAQGQITAASGNSISIPTPNNGTLTLGTSAGLDGSASFTANQSGDSTYTVSLDLSELTDMTETMVDSQDEFIVLDNGAERRKLASEVVADLNLVVTGGVAQTGTLISELVVADTITANHIQVATTSGSGIYMELVSGKGVISIKDGTTTRVKIGYLGT